MAERNAAFVAGGSAAFASSVLALLLIWMLLTRPMEVANAVGNARDLNDLVTPLATSIYEMVLRLLELL